MTKNEFIQEAALRLITAWGGCSFTSENVADAAKNIADEVWKLFNDEQPAEPQVLAMVPDNEKVQTLAKEIARIERYEVEQKNAIKKNQGWNGRNYYQISGADVRFLNVCHHEDISTLGDMMRIGRHGFSRLRNMGPLTMELVDKAIENLYNIKSW